MDPFRITGHYLPWMPWICADFCGLGLPLMTLDPTRPSRGNQNNRRVSLAVASQVNDHSALMSLGKYFDNHLPDWTFFRFLPLNTLPRMPAIRHCSTLLDPQECPCYGPLHGRSHPATVFALFFSFC